MPDIVVCAAGVTGAKGHPLESSEKDWTEAWQTDSMSVVRILRAFVPTMEQRGWGRVAIIASEKAMQPYWDGSLCNVAKAGLLNRAKGPSRVSAAKGLLVDCVSPVFVETVDHLGGLRILLLGVNILLGTYVRLLCS
jgi:NAD(P)-dependent dehydrogenase (short-subunit alcohol dehydrogenase family)